MNNPDPSEKPVDDPRIVAFKKDHVVSLLELLDMLKGYLESEKLKATVDELMHTVSEQAFIPLPEPIALDVIGDVFQFRGREYHQISRAEGLRLVQKGQTSNLKNVNGEYYLTSD